MKKISVLCLVFFLMNTKSFADTLIPSSDREQMLQILNERREQFSTYTNSLDDATGIFGIKTKKDLKHSQKILVDIVRLDNRLIDVLNRRVDYKGFETVSLNYKQLEAEREAGELRDALKLTDKRIDNLVKETVVQRSKIRKLTFLSFFLGILFVLAVIKSYRRTKANV